MPNAYATALAGGATGTWFVTRGNQAVRYINVTAAPFLQKTLARSKYVELDGGVRADYQSGFGTILSPRISIAGKWRGVIIRGGAGLFVRSLPAAIFVAAIANDGWHLEQFMATDVSFVNVATAHLEGQGGSVRGCRRPSRGRASGWSGSRSSGGWGLSPPPSNTRGPRTALLGSRRLAEGAGWTDVVESNRAARGRRLHLQAAYTGKRQQLVANYEWTRARDNSDGPFSFLEHADNAAAEFVRSAGVSPRNFTAAGTFRLPAAVSLTISDTWRSSAPFDITTGSDRLRNGLTVDRGGRARNSGAGPGYHSVAAYRISAHSTAHHSGTFRAKALSRSGRAGRQHPGPEELHHRRFGHRIIHVRPAARRVPRPLDQAVPQRRLTTKGDMEVRRSRLLRTATVLGGLFLFDLGYSGQGLISLLVAVCGFTFLTVLALWSWLRGSAALARNRALRAGMYLVLGVATFATMRFHATTAETHAARVIDACRAFESRRGKLPDRLEELVPEFLPALPRDEVHAHVGSIHVFDVREHAPHADVRDAAAVRPEDLQLRSGAMGSARLDGWAMWLGEVAEFGSPRLARRRRHELLAMAVATDVGGGLVVTLQLPMTRV